MEGNGFRGRKRLSRSAAAEQQPAEQQEQRSVTDRVVHHHRGFIGENDGSGHPLRHDERHNEREDREQNRQPADHEVDQFGVVDEENAEQNEPGDRHDPENKGRVSKEVQRAEARNGTPLFFDQRFVVARQFFQRKAALKAASRNFDKRSEIAEDRKKQADDDQKGAKFGQLFGRFRGDDRHNALLSAECSPHTDTSISRLFIKVKKKRYAKTVTIF